MKSLLWIVASVPLEPLSLNPFRQFSLHLQAIKASKARNRRSNNSYYVSFVILHTSTPRPSLHARYRYDLYDILQSLLLHTFMTFPLLGVLHIIFVSLHLSGTLFGQNDCVAVRTNHLISFRSQFSDYFARKFRQYQRTRAS